MNEKQTPIFEENELIDLREAKLKLEYPGLTARIANFIGKPVELGLSQLPKKWNENISRVLQAVLLKWIELSINTMGKKESVTSSDWFHKFVITASGSIGGFFGLASMPVELPFSTGIILRSIADIARSEGHDISLLEVKMECLQVLALGGNKEDDDETEQGYWATRVFLAQQLRSAATFLSEKGLTEEGAPPLVRLIATIASRFGSVVTEEAMAKAIPVISAATGGGINYLFINHFQDMARGHFIVKRLENKYGTEQVKEKYKSIKA